MCRSHERRCSILHDCKANSLRKGKPTLMTNVSTRSPCQLQWNSRYVTMISRDITSIIQCLRWCKTECAACTPCSSNSEEKYSGSTAHHVKACWGNWNEIRSCKRSPRQSTGFTSFEKVHTHTQEQQKYLVDGCSHQPPFFEKICCSSNWVGSSSPNFRGWT